MCPEWPQSYIYPVLPLSEANFPRVSNKKEELEPKNEEIKQDQQTEKIEDP